LSKTLVGDDLKKWILESQQFGIVDLKSCYYCKKAYIIL